MDLHPTHTCFDDALDMMVDALKENSKLAFSNELLVVHGICLMPDDRPYAHAWLESGTEEVWFMGLLGGVRVQVVAELKSYYEEMKVQETTKYTPYEAHCENHKHVTFGPWIEKYKALCRQPGESINS